MKKQKKCMNGCGKDVKELFCTKLCYDLYYGIPVPLAGEKRVREAKK